VRITRGPAAKVGPGGKEPWYAPEGPICQWGAVALFAALATALLVYPVLRAFSMVQVGYNEGWNVYNAITVAHHLPLYPSRYSWNIVCYPALSFYIVAWLHQAGLGYLAAGRLLALLSFPVSGLLVGLIVWRLNHDYRAALFSAFFCMALFCVGGNEYIGYDDPQMLAQVFFLGGLLLYISGPPRFSRLSLTALLFVVGGCIKHSLVEFPLAVFLDLFFVGRKRVVQFASVSAVLLSLAIYAHIAAGGPYFVADVLMPRMYSFLKAFIQFMEYGFGSASLAMIAAAVWSVKALKDSRLRVVAILFGLCLIVGGLSGGYIGHWVNAYFDLYLALAMIVGLLMHEIWRKQFASRYKWAGALAPVALLVSLVPVWVAGPPIMPWAAAALPKKEGEFSAEVAFMRAHPGPAFCDSLLRCYEAGKSYDYSPMDSADLVKKGKLHAATLLDRLSRRRLAVVQLCCSIQFLEHDDDPFIIRRTLPVIQKNYRLAVSEKGCDIYVPKRAPGVLASSARQSSDGISVTRAARDRSVQERP
jgi:hypothetical protein